MSFCTGKFKMDIKNLTDDFGVEVRNFDCSKKIGYNELNLLKKTIQDRHFICFKNQKLDGGIHLLLLQKTLVN